MAPREIQAKNEQQLRVIQINQNQYYVESPDGKVVYKVHIDNDRESCTCENFQKISKSDNSFQCNHILAVKNCTPSCTEIETVEHAEKKKPKLDERFIKSIEGKDFVLYSGLLDLAHQKGLSKISIQILQLPTTENRSWAIVMATVESSQCTFSDIGDASPENCNLKIARHLIRMASTRAKARALRDFTNIGMTCLEELSGIDEVIGDETHVEKPKEKGERLPRKPRESKESKSDLKPENPPTGTGSNGGASAKTSTSESQTSTKPENGTGTGHEPQTAKPDNGGNNGSNNVPKMSVAQRKAIENLARRKSISLEEIDNMTREIYNSSFANLTSSDASSFIQHLQQNA